MRSMLHRGIALAALAGLPSGATAQPRAPASAAAPRQSACSIPDGWSAARFGGPDDPYEGNVVVNGIAVLPHGAYRWNGSPIDRRTLGRFLELSAMMTPRPILALWPDGGAGCADLAAASRLVDAHLDCLPTRCLVADVPRASTPPPAPPPPPPARPRSVPAPKR